MEGKVRVYVDGRTWIIDESKLCYLIEWLNRNGKIEKKENKSDHRILGYDHL